jgi:hypothetical protein
MVKNVVESGWRCQVQLQMGFERRQGVGKKAEWTQNRPMTRVRHSLEAHRT